jgi:hypothetical protein
MKRFALVASASLALLLGACDDDSPPKRDAAPEVRPETGSEVGSEGGVPGMCVGTFAATNRTALGAVVATKPQAQCKAAADLDLICREDIGGRFRREFAVACLPTLMGGPANVILCINELAKREYPTLSDACLGCYSASVACTLQNCLASCSVDATSAACISCQTTNGCLSTFFTCSGLPGGPTAPPADGGVDVAPDLGGQDGGVDAPVDAPADAASDTAVDAATDTGSDV